MKNHSQRNHHPAPRPRHSGADAVIASLHAQGVEVIFGMVGGQIMPVYDALHRDGKLRHIIVGHEQGGAHMAEGFARATGKAGVVMTTSGPGATNLVTGLADAMMDSTPVVAITGQVPSHLLGNDDFQEADMRGITMPITKHNYQLTSPDQVAPVFAEAFHIAVSGRPGPVLIDLPKDVTVAQTDMAPAHGPRLAGGRGAVVKGHPMQIERALQLIKNCRQPVILAGGGVIHAEASAELKALAEYLDIPVTSTLMGLGNFPGDHPLSLGMPGMHGTGYANLALYNSDVLICLGCRLDDRVTGQLESFAPNAKLVHIDVDASEISKCLPAAVPIVGDAKPVLAALLAGAQAWESRPDFAAWHKVMATWRHKYPMGFRQKDGVILPQQAVQEIAALMGEEDIVVTGVGQHQMFTAQYYTFRRPRTLITSGGLGTMGFGLPAAIGAKVARPERRVVCIDGDGSFLMNVQELCTAVRYRIPVVVAVLKNYNLGMVRQWQHMFFEQRHSQSNLACPPYDQVAKAFGALGRRVERPEELAGSLRWAFEAAEAQQLPVVLDIMVDPEEAVLPMVPAGEPNINFIPCRVEER
ncbi:MAG: biosynthetic-type acetolactate synthase large subunit [Desulfarculus sp.]|nr:biosynthetic-type acetolactate synthase large subunit [Desulfarculus sp.]